ncbi:MAG: sensor histidine kinase [Rhodocyclaceae bacterium]
MESIKQKPNPPAAHAMLPDFRNLGVMLRVLVLVNLLAMGTVLITQPDARALADDAVAMAGKLELPLFLAILLLYLIQPWLARRSRRVGTLAVLALAAAVAGGLFPLLTVDAGDSRWRWMVWAMAAGGCCIMYFEHRNRRFSPALTEARLMALTARIRPHFLFNALNGVLGVMRTDPRRAERALEELADLFRALMKENRELVPLRNEIVLCERYVDLEELRLGDRLQVRWSLEGCPRDALVPPLMLQPLLENAVYHGIEPAEAPGEIVVRGRRKGNEIILRVENPTHDSERHHVGNRMALDNIKERLMLFFDLEARLETDVKSGQYRVTIKLPYRKAAS